MPQWLESVIVSAHTPCAMQSICPFGHTQVPDTHDAPTSQTLPQVPQLALSVLAFAQ